MGYVLGPVPLNIFISDLEEATEHVLERFAVDTKLGGKVNTLKSRATIQRVSTCWKNRLRGT